MHRARQHAETRTHERRTRLAQEAARLMAVGGIRDFHQAKLKAAERLGIHDDASLPRNREIEDALREYQRLFQGDASADGFMKAVKGMKWMSPRGPVEIDPQTRDIIQNVYIRKVQRVNGVLQNVEFDTIKAVKDPGK